MLYFKQFPTEPNSVAGVLGFIFGPCFDLHVYVCIHVCHLSSERRILPTCFSCIFSVPSSLLSPYEAPEEMYLQMNKWNLHTSNTAL